MARSKGSHPDAGKAVEIPELEAHLNVIRRAVETHRDQLPMDRRPIIAITGKAGAGKTTTINTLFGKRMGRVGHDRRGTTLGRVYQWTRMARGEKAENENIVIVDLPGLGDTLNDREFLPIYREWAKKADVFVVVVGPPRPAELGTLRTVKELLKAGVTTKSMVFAVNKLGQLNYGIDEIATVSLNGLLGVEDEGDKHAVEKLKRSLLIDLRRNFPEEEFGLGQIVEYDAVSGWNLYSVLAAVVERLPYVAITKFNMEARGGDAILRREQRRIARLEKKIQEEEARLEGERLRTEERQRTRKRLALKKRREELREAKEERDSFLEEKQKYDRSLWGRISNGVADAVEIVDPSVAKKIRIAGVGIAKAASALKEGTSRLWGWLKKRR